MSEVLRLTVDKFTFQVPTDRAYSADGLWTLAERDRVRIGLTDFLQQRSGDVAFAEIKPVGSHLHAGDELAVIETIKVDLSLPAPVSGDLVEVNPAVLGAPEVINQDCYGKGWLAVIKAAYWESDRKQLLSPEEYFARVKKLAEEESR